MKTNTNSENNRNKNTENTVEVNESQAATTAEEEDSCTTGQEATSNNRTEDTISSTHQNLTPSDTTKNFNGQDYSLLEEKITNNVTRKITYMIQTLESKIQNLTKEEIGNKNKNIQQKEKPNTSN